MTSFYGLCAAALLSLPTVALAQDADRSPFAGAHIGIDVSKDFNRAKQAGAPAAANGAKRSGIAVRGSLGYDAAIGNIAVIGVEAGIGTGGRTISQRSLAGGTYRVNPGLTYDLTARAGFTPTSNILVYGRGGYRWLRTEQNIVGQATGNRSFKLTEKGFTYGGGLEVAVTPNFALNAAFDRTEYSKALKQNKVSVGAKIRF
jgi:outer membrane immunogenic protein